MLVTACVLEFLYLAILAWTLYNAKVYLWDQKRYKTFSVLTFYILAPILELSRMLMYLNVIEIYSALQNPPLLQQYYVYDVCYDIALFLKVIMGLFQVQAMAEMLVRLSRKEPREKEKLVKLLRVATFTASFVVVSTMLVEIFFFVKVLNEFYGSCPSPWDSPRCDLSGFIKYLTWLGWICGTFYTILTVCLVATYILLNKQLS